MSVSSSPWGSTEAKKGLAAARTPEKLAYLERRYFENLKLIYFYWRVIVFWARKIDSVGNRR